MALLTTLILAAPAVASSAGWDDRMAYRVEIESQNRYRRNFRLDRERDHRVFDSGNEFRVGVRYRNDERTVDGAFNVQLEKEWDLDEDRSENDARGELDTLWYRDTFRFDDDYAWAVGRQRIKEPREWWWDDKLDSVLLEYDDGPWEAFVALALEKRDLSLSDRQHDPEDADITRLLARARYDSGSLLVWDVFLTLQRDGSGLDPSGTIVDDDGEDEFDSDLNWLGLRGSGVVEQGRGKLHYWVDTGVVRGRERVVDYDDAEAGRRVVDDVERRRVSGWGVDAGITFEPMYAEGLRLHGGYAVSSGDRDPDDDLDSGFRQTGLQDNDARLATPARIRLYGELLDPEFNNLKVAMFGVGRDIGSRAAIDVFYRDYRQYHASEEFRADLRARPDGVDPDIGSALEAVFHYRWSAQAEATIVAGRFEPGGGFSAAKNRKHVEYLLLELEFAF